MCYKSPAILLSSETIVSLFPFPWLEGVQVNALANIEAKRKYEFLESISAVMDAHMRYFKQVFFFCRIITFCTLHTCYPHEF